MGTAWLLAQRGIRTTAGGLALLACIQGCAQIPTASAQSQRGQDLTPRPLTDRSATSDFADRVENIRVGWMQNDVGVLGVTYESGDNVNLEMQFRSPDGLEAIWAPKPHLGASINNDGATSQAYAGLTWGVPMPHPRLFMDLSLGASVHDGELAPEYVDRKALGSRFLFRESLELGTLIGQRHTISLMFDHVSNAYLATFNEGLDTFGIRYGIRF